MIRRNKIIKTVCVCFLLLCISMVIYLLGYNIFLKRVYPIKYENIVSSSSERYGVERELIYAVIKTESDFFSDAKSHAGARGLMQITDDTFYWLQLYRDNPGMDAKCLLDPSINIDYGTMLISMLRKRFNSDELVLSAYNAGINAVERWLKDEGLSDNGEELNYIPYKETRRYVKKVKKSRDMYRELYFK